MVFSGRSGWAVQVPFLLSGLSALCCFGAFAAVADDPDWRSIGGALLAIGLLAFTLSELRSMRVIGKDLVVRTVYGRRRLPINEIALGINVHHGPRGGPTYTIYAQSNAGKFDLGSTLTKKGSERLRDRLAAALLGGRLSADAARANLSHVRRQESLQAERSREAKRIVDEYRASGKARKTTLWTLAIVVIYMLGMGAFFWWKTVP